MKLLFDQNISYRVVKKLVPRFPKILHISQTGLKNPDDREIWDYAKQEGFTIVSHNPSQPPSCSSWLKTNRRQNLKSEICRPSPNMSFLK